MQGVEINGFAFWSIYRDEDGPFRCYKYMQGQDANDSVTAMCESVLRNLIANSSLEEVLRNRNHLRDNMRNDLKDQFKGWGIWLETVEITEVKISSDKLFKDLQAEFRQEAHLKASKIELESNEKIVSMRTESDMKISQTNELNETKKLLTRNTERIKRDQQQADYDANKNELELTKLDRESKFQIEKMKRQFEEEKQRIDNDQTAAKLKQDFELEFAKRKLDLDKEHNETSLLKYQIDVTERIYQKVGVKELRINQFSGESKTNLLSLIPMMTSGLIPKE
jgi:flotillin